MSSLMVRAAIVFGFLVSALLGACSLFPCVERRDQSGLLLVCPERMEQYANMSEELKGASSFAWSLAEVHPDDLGYPWANPDTRELELRIAGPGGETAVREWMAGNAMKSGGGKTMVLPPPAVPVKLVTADRSFRQLQELQNRIVPPKDLPDGDAIYQTGPDARRNATLITVDRQSAALLSALASRYGTEAIVISVDPNRPRIGY
jgi:hypothetical protein